jgi:hypothetical protein
VPAAELEGKRFIKDDRVLVVMEGALYQILDESTEAVSVKLLGSPGQWVAVREKDGSIVLHFSEKVANRPSSYNSRVSASKKKIHRPVKMNPKYFRP